MASWLRYLLQSTLVLVASGALIGSAALAEPTRELFGQLQLSIDAKSWRIERPAGNILIVVPIGTLAMERRLVVITQTASSDLRDCEAQARVQLGKPLYGDQKAHEVEIGGVKAIAVRASPGCRNAAPRGVAICIPHRGIGYVLADRIIDCQNAGVGGLISGSDWFQELTRGIRFVP
jgi:hypothetical protein